MTDSSRIYEYKGYETLGDASLSIDENEPQYLTKPTVVMCNPNAFYYQQMVTSPNAYWLNFFLKREINVVCWNYRGYGESEIGFFDQVDPFKS